MNRMTPPQYGTYHITSIPCISTPQPTQLHFHLTTSTRSPLYFDTFTSKPPPAHIHHHMHLHLHTSTPPPLRLHLDNFASTPSCIETHSSTFAFQSPQQFCTYTFLPLYFQLYRLTSTSTSFYLPSLTPHFHLHILTSISTMS